ncbi:hypothetical protein VRRI112168_03530 [Vreelandella rituensis]|uniref:Uncharacterized protein n=1 Tax=Vreelandella rituensis TaxID=2282306 RepID=A0A368U9U9_9GAMM|nr:hypothetical protein [Halomonas rituensis]RCV93724.1 hypothetical protein DU506_00800 [Halomonas rituensis]
MLLHHAIKLHQLGIPLYADWQEDDMDTLNLPVAEISQDHVRIEDLFGGEQRAHGFDGKAPLDNAWLGSGRISLHLKQHDDPVAVLLDQGVAEKEIIRLAQIDH